MCRPTHTVTQEQPQEQHGWLNHSNRIPLIHCNPRFIAFHSSACNLFSRRLQTVAVLRSKQSCGPSFEEGRGGKKNQKQRELEGEDGVGTSFGPNRFRHYYGSLVATRPWKPLCLCIGNKQLKPDKKQSVWGWGTAGKLRGGISRYGVVWFGWRCFCRPSPRPLCLHEDLHERALCSGPAGAPVSEWARAAAAFFSGGCLFTPASPVILH